MTFDFSEQQKKNATRADRYIQRLHRRMLCQKKGSNRRRKTRYRLAAHRAKKASIREDFAHKTSRSLVDSQAKAIVFEDLRASQRTKNTEPKEGVLARFLPNKVRKKAGPDSSVLNTFLYKMENYTRYKAYRSGKALFKIPASYPSHECAQCDSTHPDNRLSQSLFVCSRCGHTDNADHNASLLINNAGY